MYMCGMRERRKYCCSRKYSRLRTDGGFPGGKLLREKKKVTFYMWASDAEQEFDKAIVAQYEKENPDIDIEEKLYSLCGVSEQNQYDGSGRKHA